MLPIDVFPFCGGFGKECLWDVLPNDVLGMVMNMEEGATSGMHFRLIFSVWWIWKGVRTVSGVLRNDLFDAVVITEEMGT